MTGPQFTDQTGVKTLVKGANDANDSMKKEMLAVYIAVPSGIGAIGIIVAVYFIVVKIKTEAALRQAASTVIQSTKKIASTPLERLENNIIQDIDLEEARHGIRKVSNYDSRNSTQNIMLNSDLTNTTTHTQMDMSEYSSTSK